MSAMFSDVAQWKINCEYMVDLWFRGVAVFTTALHNLHICITRRRFEYLINHTPNRAFHMEVCAMRPPYLIAPPVAAGVGTALIFIYSYLVNVTGCCKENLLLFWSTDTCRYLIKIF